MWEEKAAKDKERYISEMKDYKESGGAVEADDVKDTSGGAKRKTVSKKPTVSPTKSGGGFKSKEYISDEDSSDSDEESEKKKKKVNLALPNLLNILSPYGFFQVSKKSDEADSPKRVNYLYYV